jgi:hypothetical protein
VDLFEKRSKFGFVFIAQEVIKRWTVLVGSLHSKYLKHEEETDLEEDYNEGRLKIRGTRRMEPNKKRI